jgi:hypothetical protein
MSAIQEAKVQRFFFSETVFIFSTRIILVLIMYNDDDNDET